MFKATKKTPIPENSIVRDIIHFELNPAVSFF